jgi:hypothetical protein
MLFQFGLEFFLLAFFFFSFFLGLLSNLANPILFSHAVIECELCCMIVGFVDPRVGLVASTAELMEGRLGRGRDGS